MFFNPPFSHVASVLCECLLEVTSRRCLLARRAVRLVRGARPPRPRVAPSLRDTVRAQTSIKFGRSGDAPKNQAIGKGATGAAKFTPRGTTYVFVNVVVAPRYVARLRLGSGGL